MLDLFRQIWVAIGGLLDKYPLFLDGLRLAIVGVVLETCRRSIFNVSNIIMESLTMNVWINHNDEVYDWIMTWIHQECQVINQEVPLSLQPFQNGSSILKGQSKGDHPQLKAIKHRNDNPSILASIREAIYPSARISPRNVHFAISSKRDHPWWYPPKKRDGEGEDKPVLVSPRNGKTFICVFQNKTISVKLYEDGRNDDERGWGVKLSGSTKLLLDLVDHCKSLSVVKSSEKLNLYTPNNEGHRGSAWKKLTTRPIRPWDSVILDQKLKEGLLKQAITYFNNKEFYAERGLNWRMGWLFYGVPGSGKTSFIAALASRLNLDIYMLNLGAKSLDDAILIGLIQHCPPKSILLIEDIDCAFQDRKDDTNAMTDEERQAHEDKNGSKSTNGDSTSDKDSDSKSSKKKKDDDERSKNSVTLSGLLNALDGIASSEGRLLICTTNYIEKIDKALKRAGRCDIWVEFKNATTPQIVQIFKQFYKPTGRPQSNELNGSDYTWFPKVNGIKQHHDEAVAEKANGDDSGLSDSERIITLAQKFGEIIPEDKVSISSIQAYLMRFMDNPEGAIEKAFKWVEDDFPQDAILGL